MEYEPNKKSVSKHEVPEWFHDAKFGIFIHWGLYSVPAFAVIDEKNYAEIITTEGPEAQFKKNPYAEWYLNSLRIPGTATEKHHKETYGAGFSYDDFIPEFNEAIKKWNPGVMAAVFKSAGAKYVVLVTKHHDGFLLWPSEFKNPRKDDYCAGRDIVGDLTRAVKERGMKMGFYYSGVLDWSFNENPITSIASMINNGTDFQEYIDYANSHWRELIDKYEPVILWNDIGYPTGTNIYELFSYFYNKFPDGVINDRWTQWPIWVKKGIKFKPVEKIVNWIIKLYLSKKGATMPSPNFHHDYVTPEYVTFKDIKKKKWESTRGIGHSFGYNKMETVDQYLKLDELVHMFVDIVSKNGNLLLNVGPMTDGTIPEVQKNLLLEFGKWLEVNGDALFGTRPWTRAEGRTREGVEIRFTKKDEDLFFVLLGNLPEKLVVESFHVDEGCMIQLLGNDADLNWSMEGQDLVIDVPPAVEKAPAHAFKISGYIKME